MAITFPLLALCLVFLSAEAILHRQRLKRIKLRITISGTRGKTGLTRDMASILRASGINVLAKTTGSEAMYILPDGSEKAVPRRGMVSIIEQKRLVAKAARMGVDCLAAEIMSINPENHRAESRMILRPHMTLFTNFRPDHLDVSGEIQEEYEAVFLNDINRGADIFIHRNHLSVNLEDGISNAGATLHVAEKWQPTNKPLLTDAHPFRVEENTDLAFAAARHLGISDTTIEYGLTCSKHDAGKAGVYRFDSCGKTIWFANTFAANDPVSTMIMVNKIISITGIEFRHIAGLLSLRNDRAERTMQWIKWLKNEGIEKFPLLYVTGRHKNIIRRKLPCTVLPGHLSPASLTGFIISSSEDRTLVFGLANIGGTGKELAAYWQKEGQEVIPLNHAKNSDTNKTNNSII